MSKKEGTGTSAVRRIARSRGMQAVMWVTMVILLVIAVFSMLYTTVVVYTSGTGTSFLWFWPVTFFVSMTAAIGLFLVLTGRVSFLYLPAAVLTVVFWVFLIFLSSLLLRIFVDGRKTPVKNADYLVVLGAQVRGSVPSLVLNARINTAAKYLKENPETIVIASGGKGDGENISEAEAIKNGLIRLGISEDRILLEAASTSTMENLTFSSYKMEKGKTKATVVLVTNDFHIYRAVRVARKMGYEHVSGCGASEHFAVTFQYYIRECLGVVAEFLRGTI